MEHKYRSIFIDDSERNIEKINFHMEKFEEAKEIAYWRALGHLETALDLGLFPTQELLEEYQGLEIDNSKIEYKIYRNLDEDWMSAKRVSKILNKSIDNGYWNIDQIDEEKERLIDFCSYGGGNRYLKILDGSSKTMGYQEPQGLVLSEKINQKVYGDEECLCLSLEDGYAYNFETLKAQYDPELVIRKSDLEILENEGYYNVTDMNGTKYNGIFIDLKGDGGIFIDGQTKDYTFVSGRGLDTVEDIEEAIKRQKKYELENDDDYYNDYNDYYDDYDYDDYDDGLDDEENTKEEVGKDLFPYKELKNYLKRMEDNRLEEVSMNENELEEVMSKTNMLIDTSALMDTDYLHSIKKLLLIPMKEMGQKVGVEYSTRVELSLIAQNRSGDCSPEMIMDAKRAQVKLNFLEDDGLVEFLDRPPLVYKEGKNGIRLLIRDNPDEMFSIITKDPDSYKDYDSVLKIENNFIPIGINSYGDISVDPSSRLLLDNFVYKEFNEDVEKGWNNYYENEKEEFEL